MWKKGVIAIGGLVCGIGIIGLMITLADGEEEKELPVIPGITAVDNLPNGCVDCHKNYPEQKKDYRLSTVLDGWHEKVSEEDLKKAQAAAPAGVVLKGKHPDVRALVKVIPDDCIMCHSRESKTVPPFSKLLHSIHLVGGKENHFITSAGGNCTHCHKLDKSTGTWSLGSGKEN